MKPVTLYLVIFSIITSPIMLAGFIARNTWVAFKVGMELADDVVRKLYNR